MSCALRSTLIDRINYVTHISLPFIEMFLLSYRVVLNLSENIKCTFITVDISSKIKCGANESDTGVLVATL